MLSEKRVAQIKLSSILTSALNSPGGFKNLYRGLTPALLRQVISCTLRMGLFYDVEEYVKKTKKRSLTLLEKAPYSMLFGCIGAFIACPCHVATVRMQNDMLLEEHRRRNYSGLINAFYRIAKEESIQTLWRGWIPTIFRAAFLNFSLLVPYEESKRLL